MAKSPTILTTWFTAVLAAVVISAPAARTARADEKPMEAWCPVDLTVREVGTDGQDTRQGSAPSENDVSAGDRPILIQGGECRVLVSPLDGSLTGIGQTGRKENVLRSGDQGLWQIKFLDGSTPERNAVPQRPRRATPPVSARSRL